MKRKYQVFDYTWHIAHQYDMIRALGDDCNFFHGLNIKRHWETNVRPLPSNLSYVAEYENGKYDVAILHVDQECIVPGHPKRMIYDQFNKAIGDIPKLVINHGSPVYPELFHHMGYKQLTESQMHAQYVSFFRTLIGDNTMIVNSHTAGSSTEWTFGHPVIHGMDPNDWWDLPKEPRAFTAISPYGFDTYVNRRCLIDVSDQLFNIYGYTLSYARVNIDTSNSWEDYKNYLGRSLIYFDPSYRTPMNRARTEAFLSGCCVIQVEGAHDLDRWAIDGENIILVPDDPALISAAIADMIENRYEDAVKIGQKGKQMAIKQFAGARYRNEWLQILEEVCI